MLSHPFFQSIRFSNFHGKYLHQPVSTKAASCQISPEVKVCTSDSSVTSQECPSSRLLCLCGCFTICFQTLEQLYVCFHHVRILQISFARTRFLTSSEIVAEFLALLIGGGPLTSVNTHAVARGRFTLFDSSLSYSLEISGYVTAIRAS